MRKIIMGLALAASCLVGAGAALAEDAARRITVTGEGVARAAPDMAVLTLGVRHQAATAAEALAATNAGAAAVLGRLSEAGIADRDMQTSGLSLSPIWDRSNDHNVPPKVVGFEASNTVTIRARDLSALGGILDAVVADGANEFRGLQFTLQEPGPLQASARKLAVADAIARAALYAEAAGLRLGPVMTIRDPSAQAAPMPMMRAEMAMADAGGVPIAQGELELRAEVVMEFKITN